MVTQYHGLIEVRLIHHRIPSQLSRGWAFTRETEVYELYSFLQGRGYIAESSFTNTKQPYSASKFSTVVWLWSSCDFSGVIWPLNKRIFLSGLDFIAVLCQFVSHGRYKVWDRFSATKVPILCQYNISKNNNERSE